MTQMDLTQIFSLRNVGEQNYAQTIIYEWEDEIANELDIPVLQSQSVYRMINKLDVHSPFICPFKNTFRFVTNSRNYDEPMNNKYIVPCIIDFFERKNQLQEFYKKHSRNRIVLLSSPFDFTYLKNHNCPLNIGLFPYSLPDSYRFIDRRKEKKYDIVLTGRQDPLLYSFFVNYIKCHPDVTYVKRGLGLENDVKKTQEYYINGRECLGFIESRKDFINLQLEGRVTLYGVQGYSDGMTKGFYHMTPHFLEIIASGCHVLMRYPEGKMGVDAKYYEFERFSPSLETYEDFESAMDKALNTEVDIEMYSLYLEKHYTSARIMALKELLKAL